MDKILSAGVAVIAVGALAFTSAGASSDIQQCAADLSSPSAALVDTAIPIRPASLGPAADDREIAGEAENGGLPAWVTLRPIPARYADGYAVYERYRYAVVGNDAFIVDPATRQIIAKLR
jgi:hypothetical protein